MKHTADDLKCYADEIYQNNNYAEMYDVKQWAEKQLRDFELKFSPKQIEKINKYLIDIQTENGKIVFLQAKK